MVIYPLDKIIQGFSFSDFVKFLISALLFDGELSVKLPAPFGPQQVPPALPGSFPRRSGGASVGRAIVRSQCIDRGLGAS